MITLEEFCRLRDEHAVERYAESLAKARAALTEAEAAWQPVLDRWRAFYRELQVSTVTNDDVWMNKLRQYKAELWKLDRHSAAYQELLGKRDADVTLAGRVMSLRADVKRLEKLYFEAQLAVKKPAENMTKNMILEMA